MLDFTSSQFLGWRHTTTGSSTPLTTGRPAALDEPVGAILLAARIAAMQGADAGVVHRTALHALIDVLTVASVAAGCLLIDDAAYPLLGVAVAAAAGSLPVIRYRHHSVTDVRCAIAGFGPPPLVLTDGWCTGCSRPAPLAALHAVVRQAGGLLVVDDTQAAGVLGSRASGAAFGIGGAGTLRWLGDTPRSVVQVASLAKGYGAPLSISTGSSGFIDAVRSAAMRWHSSPPTSADLAAADRALTAEPSNARRRQYLGALVVRLRVGLRRLGLPALGLPFPVVSIPVGAVRGQRLLARLRGLGIRALLVRARCQPAAALTFAISARHTAADIDRVLAGLARWSR